MRQCHARCPDRRPLCTRLHEAATRCVLGAAAIASMARTLTSIVSATLASVFLVATALTATALTATALTATAFAATAFAATAFAAPALAETAPPHDRPQAPVILIVGDSISAGYGLDAGQGWGDLLSAKLEREGYPQRVVNASISGDTTAGGRARLPALLREYRPAVVVVELGGNDALRGGDLGAARANLDAIVQTAQAARAKVLLLGMKIPPNYGPTYVRTFEAIFPEVARVRGVALVPWLFAGFGEDLALFQPDRIHPLPAAQPRILDNVWPALAGLLAKQGRVAPRAHAG